MMIQILIVEDEVVVRNSVKKMIEKNREQVKVHTAGDPVEAQELCELLPMDLIILDIQLPGMDGLTYLQNIRKSNPQLPVIILTAHAEFSYAQQAIDLGVTKYLVKPISRELLLEALDFGINQIEPKSISEHISIQKALDYIHHHYSEPLTLQQLAEVVHLNTSYFSALFKQSVGTNFSQYLTAYRLKEAKQLLNNESVTIEEISMRVGYKTSKYFIQIFKENEGITPNQFRKIRKTK